MSHYLIEQIAGLAEHRGAHEHAGRRGGGRRPPRAASRLAGPDGDEEVDAGAMFIFIGAAPYTDWLGDHVARDARGFVLAGARRGGRRRAALAAGARSVPARDDAARRVRRRRRPPPLDQARGQRGRRGLDERAVHPPVPGRRMSVSVEDLRRVDLFDGVEDEALLARWAAAARGALVRAGRDARRRGDESTPFKLVLDGRIDGYLTRRRARGVGPRARRPDWAGAIIALARCRRRSRCAPPSGRASG